MSKIIIGEKFKKDLEKNLRKFGFDCITISSNPSIDYRVSFHPDLSLFKEKKKIILSKYLYNNDELVNQLTNDRYEIFHSQEQNAKYPNDANLCACVINDCIIHNYRFTDVGIKELSGYQWINVKQGYCRCMICIVDETSIITSDKGIARTLMNKGFNVLVIDPTGIRLDGYSNGFIGGCSFNFENSVYFTGNLNSLTDKQRIINFVLDRKKNIYFLTDQPAFDIGGAIIV